MTAANPQYDGSALTSWKYGVDMDQDSAPDNNGYRPDANAFQLVQFMLFPLYNFVSGIYTINSVRSFFRTTSPGVIDQVEVGIYSAASGTALSGTFTKQTSVIVHDAGSGDFLSGTSTIDHTFDLSSNPLIANLADTSANDYVLIIGIRKTAVAGQVGMYTWVNTAPDAARINNNYWKYHYGSALPESTAAVGNGTNPGDTKNRSGLLSLLCEIGFTTTNRMVYKDTSVSSSAINMVKVPRRTDGDYWLICKGVNAASDTNSTTISLTTHDSNNQIAEIATATVDYGATNQMTFGPAGAEVSNAFATTGAVEAAADLYDLGFNIRPTANEIDLFYCNKTHGQGGEQTGGASTDITTISHATKQNATRGSSYAITDGIPYVMFTRTGAGVVDSITVCTDMLVMFGDSQASRFWNSGYGDVLPTALTHDREYWNADISGNKFMETSAGYHTAGYLRYQSPTPGIADISEMTSIVFVYAGMGANDLSNTKNNSASVFASWLDDFNSKLTTIINDVKTDSFSDAIIIGSPPTKGLTANLINPHTLLFNTMLTNVAIATLNTFYDPYDLVYADIDTWIDGNTVVGTDGNHYYCTLNHTSGASTKPISGGSWATNWALTGTSESDSPGLAEIWGTSTAYTDVTVHYLTAGAAGVNPFVVLNYEAGIIPDVATTTTTFATNFVSYPTGSRGTRLTITSAAGAISTQWDFTGASTFTVTTGANTGAFGSVLDSDIDFVDYWLPPFHIYLVRTRQYVNGVWTEWTTFQTVVSRGPVNSFENYTILNANTTTIG